VINRTLHRGGIVIIPSLAVGRAQQLMYYIHLLKEQNGIPDIPSSSTARWRRTSRACSTNTRASTVLTLTAM
jgi:Cft2 family RNA processing exonuclease